MRRGMVNSIIDSYYGREATLPHGEISPAPSFPKRGTCYKRCLEGSPFDKGGQGDLKL